MTHIRHFITLVLSSKWFHQKNRLKRLGGAWRYSDPNNW